MTTEILLALLASLFTASASVAQRAAAARAPGELRFRLSLVTYLLHRPLWILGILCMIAGFLFQLAALRIGDLSLVEPVIASELLFVFAYLAVRQRDEVRGWDWLAAAGMAVSLGGFLYLSAPRGGTATGGTGWTWLLAAAATAAAAALVAALSQVSGRRPASPARRAALLSVSAGIIWGFVAAVVKELGAHVDQGLYAVLSNWSPYVLLAAGMVAMYVVSNAFQAGPLAASQPGLTIVDPVVAILLGITVFGEHMRHSGPRLGGEILCAVVLMASVVLLARSPLIAGRPAPRTPTGTGRRRGRGRGTGGGGLGGQDHGRAWDDHAPDEAMDGVPVAARRRAAHRTVSVVRSSFAAVGRRLFLDRRLFTGLLHGLSPALTNRRSTGR